MNVNVNDDARFVSRLTRDSLALVLAGGRGERLNELTTWRAKPAVPFGGKFRIIDFALSNCVNSGVRRIGVLTQYKAHSLIRHLIRGWGELREELGEFMDILPASQRVDEEWYRGTADAIYQNLDIIRNHQPKYVIILGGDHIYKMDYGLMLAEHVEKEADVTVGCIEVPLEEAANAFGVAVINDERRIVEFQEKPAHPTPTPDSPDLCLASMGIYIFNTEFLYERLIADTDMPDSRHDFGADIVPYCVPRYRVQAYPFRTSDGEIAYWRDVGTLDSYWEANMELVAVVPELNLYDRDWPILTDQAQLPPAKFIFDDDDGRRGMAIDSVVSGGCVISGAQLRRSLLFSSVRIEARSRLSETVVLPDVTIGENCDIQRAVIDRGCNIAPGTRIGHDPEADRARGFRVTPRGIVLVTPDMLNQPIHFLR
ncbi:MAG: glucose-1-phosphate adenylyltransferase [Gammaproteobacteria bacterium]|nr:glucose-1-phosphate adenylyltransferase [Gammaproteobacteria bacterium]